MTSTAAFTIAPYDLRDIGRGWGATSIAVAVHGYWSRDPIQIRVSRDISRDIDWAKAHELGEDHYVWTVTVSHSSGGRDGAVIADDVQAEENFGHALVAAAAEARKIREQIPAIAAFNAEWRAEVEAAHEAEKAAKQAKIDADPALGALRADSLVTVLTNKTRQEDIFHFFARGADKHTDSLTVRRGRDNAARFLWNGTAVSRKVAAEKIAATSNRNASLSHL